MLPLGFELLQSRRGFLQFSRRTSVQEVSAQPVFLFLHALGDRNLSSPQRTKMHRQIHQLAFAQEPVVETQVVHLPLELADSQRLAVGKLRGGVIHHSQGHGFAVHK